MTKLTSDQVEELRKAFDVMDENKDGTITKSELTNLLSSMGESVGDDVINDMMALADENGDGKIDFEEFVKAATADE